MKGKSLMKILVTGGAIIRDQNNRILFQKRSDYGNWGLPGGAMEPGESVEDTMKREVYEETGLEVISHELYKVYSGPRMRYRYPDGNEVVFVMFVFNVKVDLEGKLMNDGKSLIFTNLEEESLRLEFISLEDIKLEQISSVQRPLIEDMKNNIKEILRN